MRAVRCASPGTMRPGKISPEFPPLVTHRSSEVFHETQAALSPHFRHSSLCFRQIRAHFKDIHLQVFVAIREFLAEVAKVCVQGLDFTRQSSHIVQQFSH
jgi:hypothetical protein